VRDTEQSEIWVRSGLIVRLLCDASQALKVGFVAGMPWRASVRVIPSLGVRGVAVGGFDLRLPRRHSFASCRFRQGHTDVEFAMHHMTASETWSSKEGSRLWMTLLERDVNRRELRVIMLLPGRCTVISCAFRLRNAEMHRKNEHNSNINARRREIWM